MGKEESCKGCPDRTVEPNCHTTCEYHLKRVKTKQRENEARRAEQNRYVNMYANSNCRAGRVKGKW